MSVYVSVLMPMAMCMSMSMSMSKSMATCVTIDEISLEYLPSHICRVDASKTRPKGTPRVSREP